MATVGSIIIWELSTSAIFYIKFGMLDINLFRKDCSDGWQIALQHKYEANIWFLLSSLFGAALGKLLGK